MAKKADAAHGFNGEKLYQQRARIVLPMLVRQAWSGQPVRYEMLATEAGMSNPRNLNYPLGCIGERLDALADEWDDEIPHIQSLVVGKGTGLPGDGFDGFLRRQGYGWEKGNKTERRAVIQEYWTKVYEYPYWADVLEELDLEPAPVPAADEIEAARRFGGGEGEEHRALKAFLCHNPHLVGLRAGSPAGEPEICLPSGDSVDVVFESARYIHAVEVKPANAPVADVTRGLFQCVKYRAVIRANLRHASDRRRVSAVLALGGVFPEKLTSLRNSLNVEVRDRLAEHME